MGSFVLYVEGKRTNKIGSIERLSEYVDATSIALKHRWNRVSHYKKVYSKEIPIKIGSKFDDERYMLHLFVNRPEYSNHPRNYNRHNKLYIVYDNNDNVIILGTAEECANKLQITLNAFYSKVSNEKSAKYNRRRPHVELRKYRVFLAGDE